MSAMIRTRRQKKLFLLVGTIGLAYLVVACLWMPTEAMLSLLSDDAFYYFKIAENIAAGRGSTFDGILLTNGYHPLWMLVMVSIFKLTSGSSLMFPIVVVMGLSGVMALATVTLVYRTAEVAFGRGFGYTGHYAAVLINVAKGNTRSSRMAPKAQANLAVSYGRPGY